MWTLWKRTKDALKIEDDHVRLHNVHDNTVCVLIVPNSTNKVNKLISNFKMANENLSENLAQYEAQLHQVRTILYDINWSL